MNNYPNPYYQQNQAQGYQSSAVQNNGVLGWDDVRPDRVLLKAA